eukprot:m.187380 g.187380  ORF g.187380 m.187380 type:complete len:1011 (+) comp17050_c0_seq1:40-3072(+)
MKRLKPSIVATVGAVALCLSTTVCSLPSTTTITPPIPSNVPNVSLQLLTSPADSLTVVLSWCGVGCPGPECTVTYDVLYRPSHTTGRYTRISPNPTSACTFVHAQGSDTTALLDTQSKSRTYESTEVDTTSPTHTTVAGDRHHTKRQTWHGPSQTRWPVRATRAHGCYAVRAVSESGDAGPLSNPVCVPDTITSTSVVRVPHTGPVCGGLGNATTDWLTHGCAVSASMTTTTLYDGSTAYTLANGIVSRTLIANTTTGLLGTTSITMLGGSGAGEKLNAWVHPEALMSINGVPVVVGGGGPTVPVDHRPRASFSSVSTSRTAIRAGGFHHVPGVRGSDPRASWPPRGLRADFNHSLPCTAVRAGVGNITVTVSVEIYDETSSFGRRVLVAHTCTEPLYVFNMSISLLNVVHDRSIVTHTDAAVAMGTILQDTFDPVAYHANMFLPIAPSLSTFGPGLSDFEAGDDAFESYFVVECVSDVEFSTDPATVVDRYGLMQDRTLHVVAPQLAQSPVRVSVICTGGQKIPPGDGNPGSVGYWCYDDEGLASVEALLQQGSEAGVEMMIFAQNMNATWRSLVGNEFQSPANVSYIANIVSKAHAAGIEMGAYELLLNARSATALNQCAPDDAANHALHPNAGYDTMDPTTLQTCHNDGSTTCKGGPGCCSMCGATAFFTAMAESITDWWRATAVSAVDQDGGESNRACANTSHAHHHGVNDSIWMEYQAVRDLYQTYLSLPAGYATSVVPPVGIIFGMPGSVISAGQSKVPGGYSEMTFSLPRWVWIDRTRERLMAMNEDTVIRQRFYPIPLSAPYHPSAPDPTDPNKFRPVIGHDSVATLSPLEQHVDEIEWALSGVFGSGATPLIRGYKLWDGPQSKEVVTKWIAWAKKYRRVLSSEFLVLEQGTTCWGRGDPVPNATCTSTGVDAILHRAPQAYYGDISERGLAMVWNPTLSAVNVTLKVPLYYAGLSVEGGTHSVMVSKEGAAAMPYALGTNDTISIQVSLGPRKLTWFVIS